MGLVIALVTFSLAVFPASVAQAGGHPNFDYVTNCSDSGSGSLPYVVQNAAEGDVIEFALSPPCSTVTLTSPVDITTNYLDIDGPGASSLAVSGNGATTVFEIGSDVTATISGLTIEDGDSEGGGGGGILNNGDLTVLDSTLSDNDGTGVYGGTGINGGGGGIASLGNLTIMNSTLSGNMSYGSGAGIYNSSGILQISDSTLSDNAGSSGGGSAQHGGTLPIYGGGIYNVDGSVSITESTLSDNNSGPAAGGGVFNGGGSLTINASTVVGNNSTTGGGGILNGGTANITNSTIIGNTNTFYGYGINGGGGILNEGSLTVSNSTLSYNSATNSSDTVSGSGGSIYGGGTLTATLVSDSPSGGDCSQPVTDDGYNIDDDGSCGFSAPSISDSTTLDSTLGSFANNGGPTETEPLLAGSPAIDQVPSVDCPATDQRGAPRVAPCDIGAYDTDGNPTITKFKPAKGRVGKKVTITGTNLSGATGMSFNGTPAVITKDTATKITCRVPPAASTGPISITTSVGGTVTSAKTFKVI